MTAPAIAVVVEVAVDSAAGARTATRAGAHRLELCSALELGGLTPSLGLVRQVVHEVEVPVMAMVRPRAGDFLYGDDEFEAMLADVGLLRQAGVAGIVSGALTADGDVDERRVERLVAAAAPLPVTFHRAFDLCRDADAALARLAALGVRRVLTSGQQSSAPAGSDRIAALVHAAADRIGIVAGAGIRAHNAAALVAATGVREVHLSASARVASAMRHRRDGVPMGNGGGDEYTMRVTDGDEVRRVVAAVAEAARRPRDVP